MLKYTSITLLLILAFCTCQAQEQRSHELQFAFGSSFGPLKDQTISSKALKTLAGTFQIAYRFQNPKWISDTQILAEAGYMNFNNFPSYSSRSANHYRFEMYSEGLYKIWNSNNERFQIATGGRLQSRYEYNEILSFSNSASNFNWFTTFGPSAKLFYKAPFCNNRLQAYTGVHLPLVAYALRPGYSVPFVQDHFEHKNFTSLNDYFALDTQLGCVFQLQSGNSLGLEYQWSYWQYTDENPMYRAIHNLSLRFNFKL